MKTAKYLLHLSPFSFIYIVPLDINKVYQYLKLLPPRNSLNKEVGGNSLSLM